MADDRITQRERGYASSLEAQIAAATRGALAAHRESMHDYFDFINLIESSEQPNLVFSYAFLAGTRRLRVVMEVPKVVALAPREFDVQKATLDTSFYIQSTEKDLTATDTKINTQAQGSFGFGLFKLSASMSAQVGVKTDRQRSTDQRSECRVHVELGPGEIPEGIARVRDIYLQSFDVMGRTIAEAVTAQINELADKGEFVQFEEVTVSNDDAAE